MDAGIGSSAFASTTHSSASPPCPASASMRMPTLTFSTPGATSVTTPAISLPGVNGGSLLLWYLPAIISVSGKPKPTAWTRRRTQPGFSAGDGTSRTPNLGGGP